MDRFEGSAWLEWWANRSTCLGSLEVCVRIVVDDSGWRASAAIVSALTGEDSEGWAFLMELSPYFTLRFEADESAVIDVRVDETESGEIALTAA